MSGGWTGARIDRLKRLAADGFCAGEIARDLWMRDGFFVRASEVVRVAWKHGIDLDDADLGWDGLAQKPSAETLALAKGDA